MTALAGILPHIAYLNGFVFEGKVLPYYNFCQSAQGARWSEGMNAFIAETTKDHFIDRYNRRIAVQALAPALENPDATYMDVGCGPGYLLEDVLSAYPRANVFGSDYIAGGLLQCHQAMPHVPLFQMSLTQCPLPDNFFDGVSCLNVLEHIEEDREALVQLRRILKPNGLAVITVPAGPSLYDFNDEIHFHVRRYTVKALREKCREAGLKVLHANYFGVAIFPAFFVRKKWNQWFCGGLSKAHKHEMALHQANRTRSMPWLKPVCDVEFQVGKVAPYPAGVRAYAIASK